MPQPKINPVVSTTFHFQRARADILQVSDNLYPNLPDLWDTTAENGLAPVAPVERNRVPSPVVPVNPEIPPRAQEIAIVRPAVPIEIAQSRRRQAVN